MYFKGDLPALLWSYALHVNQTYITFIRAEMPPMAHSKLFRLPRRETEGCAAVGRPLVVCSGSRLDSVAAAVAGGGEDPLDNEEQVADQLDAIPFLCRFQYARTAEYLLQFLDPLVAAYTDAATPGLPRTLRKVVVLLLCRVLGMNLFAPCKSRDTHSIHGLPCTLLPTIRAHVSGLSLSAGWTRTRVCCAHFAALTAGHGIVSVVHDACALQNAL